MGIFLALISGDYFLVLRIQKYMGGKKQQSIVASDFRNWFYVVLIGLVCVIKGKAKATAAASERGFGEHGRSIAGDVESPLLLPLVLLLPPPPLC